MSITEVSKVAGVSIATVSRVLNGYPYVSKSARDAVHIAIEKVGYQPPTERAVGRPRGTPHGTRTGNIAVLFPDVNQEALRTPLSGRLLHGVGEVLRRKSLTMVVAGLDQDGGMPASIQRRQVDGIIVRGTTNTAELRSSFAGLPCVWVFESGYQASFDVDMVLEDNAAIGVAAAKWLLARGHRRLAILNLLPAHPSFRVRRIFYSDEAEQQGATVLSLHGDREEAPALLDRLAQQTERPTGLFVPGGDAEVVEVYRGLKERGMNVGHDIDLISCNNDPHRLSALDPALPNIDIQPEAIGRAAVDTLLWRIGHPKEQRRRMVVPPVVVEASVATAS